MQPQVGTFMCVEPELSRSVLIVVDSSLRFDRRVARHSKGMRSCTYVDIREPRGSGFTHWLLCFTLFLRALAVGLTYLGVVPRILPIFQGGIFSGLRACWRNITRAQASAAFLEDYDFSYGTVVANDLYAGAACARSKFSGVYIYDSHEVQFHRNRSTGFLRIITEVGLEHIVLKHARRSVCVNFKIRSLMRRVYTWDHDWEVVYNDFYTHIDVEPNYHNGNVGILYVGMGLEGRRLDLPKKLFNGSDFEYFCAYLGEAKTSYDLDDWTLLPEEYEQFVVALMQEQPIMMWCYHETRSLSYTLSTPNKFFQAIALGIPIIANQKSYIGSIVVEHNIGLVVDDLSLNYGSDFLRSRHCEWRGNVIRFRSGLASGAIKI